MFSNPPTPYYCLGFLFDQKICYLSDVSFVPEEVWAVLDQHVTLPVEHQPQPFLDQRMQRLQVTNDKTRGVKNILSRPVLQTMIVDCLRIETFTSHFGLGEAIAVARRSGALKSYLVKHHQKRFIQRNYKNTSPLTTLAFSPLAVPCSAGIRPWDLARFVGARFDTVLIWRSEHSTSRHHR